MHHRSLLAAVLAVLVVHEARLQRIEGRDRRRRAALDALGDKWDARRRARDEEDKRRALLDQQRQRAWAASDGRLPDDLGNKRYYITSLVG